MAKAKATVVDTAKELSDLLNQTSKTVVAEPAELPAKKKTSRSVFEGDILIPNPAGGVLTSIHVKTYVAQDEDKIERHMYHGIHPVLDADGNPTKDAEGKTITADCQGGLAQGAMTCKVCNTVVSKKDAAYGVEVDGKIVYITDDEMKAQQSIRDGKIKITEYIKAAEIDMLYLYGEAEYVAPEGTQVVKSTFAMLVRSLRNTNTVAKGVRFKGGREQYFILRPVAGANGEDGLTLHYLRTEYEVRECTKFVSVAVDDRFVTLMSRMIDTTVVAFTPANRDQYLVNVNRLIQQKAAGENVEVPTMEDEQTAPSDLMASLEAALAATAGGK